MFLRNIRAPPARVPYAETILWMFRLPSCAFLYLNISRPAGCDGGARGSGACALRDVCRKAANSPRTVTSAPPPPFEKGRRKLFVQYFLQNHFFDRLQAPDVYPEPQSVEKGESAIRETKKAEAGYRTVFARTCASQTLLIGEK